jgi:hypothetical protein
MASPGNLSIIEANVSPIKNALFQDFCLREAPDLQDNGLSAGKAFSRLDFG